jgi:hypothetical protein
VRRLGGVGHRGHAVLRPAAAEGPRQGRSRHGGDRPARRGAGRAAPRRHLDQRRAAAGGAGRRALPGRPGHQPACWPTCRSPRRRSRWSTAAAAPRDVVHGPHRLLGVGVPTQRPDGRPLVSASATPCSATPSTLPPRVRGHRSHAAVPPTVHDLRHRRRHAGHRRRHPGGSVDGRRCPCRRRPAHGSDRRPRRPGLRAGGRRHRRPRGPRQPHHLRPRPLRRPRRPPPRPRRPAASRRVGRRDRGGGAGGAEGGGGGEAGSRGAVGAGGDRGAASGAGVPDGRGRRAAVRHRLGGALQLGPHRRAAGGASALVGPARRGRGGAAPVQPPRQRLRGGLGGLHRRHAGDPRARRPLAGRVRLPGRRDRRRPVEAGPAAGGRQGPPAPHRT